MNAVWSYRGFIVASVKREFQSKYRNSLFGMLWAVANPLCMIFIYTIIFAKVMQARLPGEEHAFAYSIYLCSGITTWFFFSEIICRSLNMFIDNAGLIKKLNFPRLCLPFIVLLGALINFVIIFGLFTAFLCFSGNFPGQFYWAVFVILAIQVVFAIGLGICLGILNVFFRDVGQLFTILLQLWFWFTPIIYSDNILPDWARAIIKLNPMYSIVNAYHDVFFSVRWPDWWSLLPVAVISFGFCMLAWHMFHQRSDEMVDEL